MQVPSSTYRVQLHKNFTFKDLLGIVDYLHALGISTIYAAPILKSTPGSIHGYDVIDPHSIDPEIGTMEDLKNLASKLRQKGMTWLQDIVPNHMAFDSGNYRLMDVLERGPASNYYNYFDIDWNHPTPELKNKIMVPFLGSELPFSVSKGEIKIVFEKKGFQVSYFDNRYPVSCIAYDYLFSISDSPEAEKLRREWSEFIRGRAFKSDFKTWLKLKSGWVTGLSETEHNTVREIMDQVNADPQILMTVLNNQHYVLTYWKTTEREINYRRFFTVNQLICLRMEDHNVFQEYHAFLLTLFDENLIQGFRIDHIDGLKDPAQYITNLRRLFGSKCYIIAEKILERKESLPVAWPLHGTSGYEFLAFLNRLFTDKKGAKQLLEFYRTLVPELPPYRQLVMKNKKLILETYMNGEWENLTRYFRDLGLAGNYTMEKLKHALGLLMISLPVYRIYPTEIPLLENDVSVMKEAFEKATQMGSSCADELDYLYHLFLSEEPHSAKTEVLSFLKRMMQFTGPLTAKGVEDTTFYVYNPLISHDEVGDSPGTLGITIGQFHKRMVTRQQNTPLSLNATATHDTKRGEDVRARLNVLSEVPHEWQKNVTEWINLNDAFFQSKSAGRSLSINDEYFIYQSIVGGFPEDFQISDAWIKRLQEYLVKVVREAKVNSNWESPNEAYENTCSQFIEHILKDDSNFLPSVLRFTQNILKAANKYALGQVLVKITAPGIPDIYQGCELWDLSYVDPDNRRPVDYELRKKYLDQILQKAKEGPKELFPFLIAHRNAGMEKLFVTWRALNFRRKNPVLFTEGDYIPLQVTGDNQMAAVYARNFQDQWIIVAVPFGLANSNENDVLNFEAAESIIMLEQLPRQWTNLFTGESIASNGYLPLKEMLKEFSVALLYNFENGKRSIKKI